MEYQTEQYKPLGTYQKQTEQSIYEGISLLEEKLFLGPTSIRYWM